MNRKAVNQMSDITSTNEKKDYFNDVFKDVKLKRRYNEVNKYCKIVKRDLDSILLEDYNGGDLNKFLEDVLRDTLIVFFTKMLEFENVDNSEELYNTLYYISFEYIKIVKKDEARKAFIDKSLPDLKALVEFFSSQVLNKESFKKFDFKDFNQKKVIGFLLESKIKTYQSKGKSISKEESEATIVYSLINLYMTGELERVFLTEHLPDFKKFKTDSAQLDKEILELDKTIKQVDKELVEIDLEIETSSIKLDKVLEHNKLVKKVFYSKKIENLEKELSDLEKKADTLLNQNKNNKRKIRSSRAKLTKLENEFKAGFDNELKELNKYYQTDLIINIEDFEDKNKLKKQSRAISKDIIERLAKLDISVENVNLNLHDYVNLKELVNNYKKKFSNKSVYHNKIVDLLDRYGYYLKS